MAVSSIPQFHNDPGVETIEIGSKTFECIGATAPYDHPHVYLDMSAEDEIVCPYCSTHYTFNQALAPDMAYPTACGKRG
ncbi:MAG: zinc-finger domain-containing protein [OCS116 cluster bacterium]|uniref:Zinc finger CHCC-type domain-containing protein n=1 Tax=OCS116 cluster bacterium TaxID=2030921 RepID=A0A2A4YTU6_9PROT|nr:zinc-finger domain-containing protein [OCS116 cluster bacterium]